MIEEVKTKHLTALLLASNAVQNMLLLLLPPMLSSGSIRTHLR